MQVTLCDHIWQVTLRISKTEYHEELYSLTLTNLTNHYAIKPQRYCKARCAKRPVMFIVPFCRRDTAVACVSWRCDRHITLTAMSLVASHSCWRQCSSDTAPATHLHTSSATSSSSVIQTGILLPRWSRHPSLSCCPSPRPSTICQQELSRCASLSTQHVRLSGVRLCPPDSLELAAWWT